jgi:hypothetical protein
MAGLGALVFPYILFVTKRHITGIDMASVQELAELREMLDSCLGSKLFPSGRLSLFEHGGSGGESCSCVDHCHIHVVDGAFDLASLLSTARSAAVAWSVEFDEPGKFPVTAPYVWAGRYHQGSENIEAFVHPAAGLGQQYFRRLLAAWIGTDHWNWRLSPEWDNIQKLVAAWPSGREGKSKR